MSRQKKNRSAFRPILGDASLEERVVLSSVAVGGHIAAAAVQNGNLTVKQLAAAYAAQDRSAFQNLNQTIKQEVQQLYAAPKRPTRQELADLNAKVAGQVNVVAFRLSSQEALLPNSVNRLVPNLQNALMSSNPNSLLSRVQAVTASNRLTNSAASLQSALTNQINTVFTNNRAQLGNFLNNTNFARASVDQSGNPIPLQQFLSQNIVNQFGSTLSGLSQGFMNAANSMLFANGAMNPSSSALQTFQGQAGNALNLAAFQLANNLNLLNGAPTTLLPQLQSGIFGSSNPGTGTGSPTGLFNALQALPFGGSSTDFSSGVSSAFNQAFSNVSSSIGSFFNNPAQVNSLLPPSNTIFNPTFTNSNFFGGFNSGFGSGFPGFGTAPSSVNPNFPSSFRDSISMSNNSFGFNVPIFVTTAGRLGSGTSA